MRTVVTLVMVLFVVGALVRACQPEQPPTFHITPQQCAALVANGSLTPDANGVVTCP